MLKHLKLTIAAASLLAANCAFAQIPSEYTGVYKGTIKATTYLSNVPLKSSGSIYLSIYSNGNAYYTTATGSDSYSGSGTAVQLPDKSISINIPGLGSIAGRIPLKGKPGKLKAQGNLVGMLGGYVVADMQVKMTQGPFIY